jgi:exo-1,4-beta-D-glucosaminidase
MVRATIKNPSGSLAFFVRPAVLQEAGGSEIAPSFWKENCVSLMPGEEKTMTASFYARNLSGASPVLRVEGWNAVKQEVPLSK